jgi:succinate-semialdehyde dehydrogenase/glutarate-semialdehyde dehydrogenase
MVKYPDLHLHIDGEWLEAGSRRVQAVINPATGATLSELPLVDAADLDRALDAARRGFIVWRATAPEARGRILKKAAELLRERSEAIVQIATSEQGKTLAEMRVELQMAAGTLEWAGEEARRLYGRVLRRACGTRSLVSYEPVGPVAAFAPWNFPLGNPARKFGAALGAGCSCILKPAEEAPASALAVLQALLDAGLPKGVAQIVFGVPDEVSRQLLASPVIRKISFTGSVAVGKHLMKLAADGMKRTTMELGGHAPVLVFDDADIDRTLELTVASKFRNAGQVCIAPTRFYIQENVYERFVNGFAERAAALRVGNGLDLSNQMGPLANDRRPRAVEQFVADATQNHARVVTGGQGIGKQGYFWQPTVLAEVPNAARVMNEEPFGPLAMMTPFRSFDDAIVQANRLPFGLAAYAFTNSAKRVIELGEAIETGMLGINTTAVGGADSPFGGVKDSGHGAEDGPEGVAACLVTKAIHQA